MSASEARSETIKSYASPQQKEKLDVLAAELFDSSMSAAAVEAWESVYRQHFGNIKPQVLQEGRLDEDEKAALIAGNIEAGDLPDEYLIEEDEMAAAPAVAAADGGEKPHPESYSATPTKFELEKSGETLGWETLKEIVSEDGRWSEDLAIHPDRVPTYDPDLPDDQQKRLKQKPNYVGKILACICRYECQKERDNDQIAGAEIEELIEEYLLPMHDRDDEDAARRYFRDKYKPKVTEHLWQHPNPEAPLYFTSQEVYQNQLAEFVHGAVDDLDSPRVVDDPESLLNYKEGWLNAKGEVHDSSNALEWKDNVGLWVNSIGELFHVARNQTEDLVEAPVDYPEDEYGDPVGFALAIAKTHLKTFEDELADDPRDTILTHHVDDAYEERIRDAL